MRASGRDGLVDTWGEDGVDRRLRQEKDQAKPSYLSATADVNRAFDYAWIGAGHGSSGAPVFNSDGQVSSVVDRALFLFLAQSHNSSKLCPGPVKTTTCQYFFLSQWHGGSWSRTAMPLTFAQAGVATGIGGMVTNT